MTTLQNWRGEQLYQTITLTCVCLLLKYFPQEAQSKHDNFITAETCNRSQ